MTINTKNVLSREGRGNKLYCDSWNEYRRYLGYIVGVEGFDWSKHLRVGRDYHNVRTTKKTGAETTGSEPSMTVTTQSCLQ